MKKKQPLSKLKYDAKHPTVSFRVTEELKERLDEVVRQKGFSYADFILEILKRKEVKEKEAYDRGYKDGYWEGYNSRENTLQELREQLLSRDAYITEAQQKIEKLERISIGSLFSLLTIEQRQVLRRWLEEERLRGQIDRINRALNNL